MNIKKILTDFNFDILQNNGFKYWENAIEYSIDKDIFKMKDVYNYIAKKHNISIHAVEISMRRCSANVKIKKTSNDTKKINTNKKILISIINLLKYDLDTIYLKKEKIDKLNFNGNYEDLGMMLISAERYALGRRTYIVSWTCKIIKRNIHILSKKHIEVMISDIQNAIDYGDDCDKKEWEELLTELKKHIFKLN